MEALHKREAVVRGERTINADEVGMNRGLWWGVVMVSFAAGYGFMRWTGLLA